MNMCNANIMLQMAINCKCCPHNKIKTKIWGIKKCYVPSILRCCRSHKI